MVSRLRLWVHVLALPRPGCATLGESVSLSGLLFSYLWEGPNPKFSNYKRSFTEGPKHSQDPVEYHLMKTLVHGSWHLWHWGSIHLASSAKEPDLESEHSVDGGAETGLGGGAWS